MSERIGSLGLAFNPTSDAAIRLRERAIAWCTASGVRAWAEVAGETAALAKSMPGTQALVVLGGDGTFLRAVQAIAAATDDVPIVGVNVGKIGFLSQVEADGLETMLERLRDGAYTLEPRMALEAAVRPASGPAQARIVGLNEAAVVRGAQPNVVRLDVSIGGSHLATYVADGLLVATPTGSTGYSFSAGGPILDPLSRNLVVTAVAGYLAAIRSVVVSPVQTVSVRILDARGVLLSVDGHIDVPLGIGDTIEVAAREHPVHFIAPEGAAPFWDLLRQKAELLPS